MRAAATEGLDWLPTGALSAERVQPILSKAVSEWSSAWFASASVACSAAIQDDWPERTSNTAWRSCGRRVSLALTPSAQAALAGAALGTNVPLGILQPNDRAVVEGIARDCADDLLVRIGRLAGGSATGSTEQGAISFDNCDWWEICLSGRRGVLKLAVARSAAAEMVKRSLPRAPSPNVEPVAAAIGGERIELCADLGRCAVSLDELDQIAVGDVLVLDCSPADPVGILVNGTLSHFTASLDADGERPVLTLGARREEAHV